jgi:hypothetical protein
MTVSGPGDHIQRNAARERAGVGGVGEGVPADELAFALSRLRELASLLRMLSEGRYTARELERVVPKEVVMGSSLVAWVKKRSRAEGRAEGAVVTARSLCAELVKQHHPAILSVVAPVIAACVDGERLQSWALAASQLSDAELVRLVGADAPVAPSRRSGSRSSRGRAPRPSRRAKPASRR